MCIVYLLEQLKPPNVKQLVELYITSSVYLAWVLIVKFSVASALSGLCFIAGGELAEVVDVMKVLEAVFLVSTK